MTLDLHDRLSHPEAARAPEPPTDGQGARRRGRRSAAVSALALCLAVATAGADQGPREHPAEAAVGLFIEPLLARTVVRNDDGGYDVWLRGGAPFEKVRERLATGARVRLELPGGWRLAKATCLDPDRSYWLDLEGAGELRIRATRDGDGTLFELKDAGLQRDAPPWVPPYAPLPLNLVHGPIR
jgi:hypothetical protein